MIELKERILFEDNQNNPSWKSWSNFRFLNSSFLQLSTNTIFKLFIFSTLVFFISCNPPKNKNIESSVNTFDECIYPRGAIIYKNHLIILGENTVEGSTSREVSDSIKYSQTKKIIAIDLYTNKIDNSAFKDMNTDSLFWLYVKNDTLFGKFKSSDRGESKWAFWNNDNWQETKDILGSNKFNNSYLRNNCTLIFEDSIYYLYGYSLGEFGNAVLFLNKATGVLRGYPMRSARQALKDSSGYIILGISYHMMESYEILKISNPDILPIVPDSLILYDYKKRNDSLIFINLENNLRNQIIEGFPQSSQDIIREANNHMYEIINDSLIICHEESSISIDSVYSSNDTISSIVLRQNNIEIICKGIFFYQGILYCILGSYNFNGQYYNLYLTELNNPESNIILENYIFRTKVPISWFMIRKFDNFYILAFTYSDYESPCQKFTYLIINDNFIKTYHFTPED